MDQIPHARLLPVTQATPARHPRPAPEFLREHLPGNTASKNEDNAGETRAIGETRPPTLWPSWRNRQERFDQIPQRIWKQRSGHACSRYLADEGQVSEVLLHALKNDTPSTPRQRPAFAAPVTLSFPGGVVETDGLHIGQTYSNAIEPSLEKGDAIIAFLVAQPDSDEFRLFHGPFGVFRVKGDELHAANDIVATYRLEKLTSAAGIRPAIERLLRQPR